LLFANFFWSPALPCLSLLYAFSAVFMNIQFNCAHSYLDTACLSSTLLCIIFCFTGVMNKLSHSWSELIIVHN
jgi:hypothetical protein